MIKIKLYYYSYIEINIFQYFSNKTQRYLSDKSPANNNKDKCFVFFVLALTKGMFTRKCINNYEIDVTFCFLIILIIVDVFQNR